MPHQINPIGNVRAGLDSQRVGLEIHALIAQLYPICRSITGDGFRQTMAQLEQHIPLELREVPSGTKAFDWTVPREWNIRDAYVKNSSGTRVIDFRRHNLHVVNYSIPVHQKMSLAQLRPHLHTLPDQPDLIPYRTTYYQEAWGFCMSHRELEQLAEDEYEVCIDSTLQDGHLTYGECVLKGASEQEFLVSCHACHPSLCNDNLSGVALATFLASALADVPLRYTYRFLFIPGTIGSITWLALNEDKAYRVQHGLVLTCLGDRGGFTYKKSRRGDAEIDRAMRHVLDHTSQGHTILEYSPYGYDERQYCSPGFNLPVGCLMRSQHGTFPQYHTSADDLEFVDPVALADSFSKILGVFEVLEHNSTYLNLNPKCEPQLGKRGLYGSMGGGAGVEQLQMAMLWVLNMSDGSASLLDIAQRSGLPFGVIHEASSRLLQGDLLAPVLDAGLVSEPRTP